MHRPAETPTPPGILPARVDVLVVGGGVSGLVFSRELRRLRPEWTCLVLEAQDRPGGTMRSDRVHGCLCEWGPAGFLTNVPHTRDLALDLGLGPRLLPARPTAESRYLWVRDALRPLPMTPAAFLKSDLLSVAGRLRVLAEPLRPGPAPGSEDSVASFAARRIGREAASTLVDAMVSGIYAGDPARLSLRATFPKMADMELRYGSLVKALIAIRRARRKTATPGAPRGGGPAGPGGVLTTFDEGLEVLIRALADELGSGLVLGAKAGGIEQAPGGYRVHLALGERTATVEARTLVLATPSFVSAALVKGISPVLSGELERIPYAGITVASLIYQRGQIRHPLEGFGFLVPRGQGVRMLGAIWVGSIFPDHAARGRVILRAMIGGARDPEGSMLSESRTVDLAHGELARVLGGIDGRPEEVVLYRHPKGIPQYVLGHPSRLEAVDRELARLPGLRLAGNAYRGIGVNDCVREARALARSVVEMSPMVPDAAAGVRA